MTHITWIVHLDNGEQYNFEAQEDIITITDDVSDEIFEIITLS